MENNSYVAQNLKNVSAASYTVLKDDYAIDLTLAGAQAVTLPLATVGQHQGRVFVFRNATNTVKTISTYTDLLGVSVTTIPANGVLELQSDATVWKQTCNISSPTATKKFRVVQALTAGANIITHNLALTTPFAVMVETRDNTTGALIATSATLETANTVTVTTPGALTNVRITVIG